MNNHTAWMWDHDIHFNDDVITNAVHGALKRGRSKAIRVKQPDKNYDLYYFFHVVKRMGSPPESD